MSCASESRPIRRTLSIFLWSIKTFLTIGLVTSKRSKMVENWLLWQRPRLTSWTWSVNLLTIMLIESLPFQCLVANSWSVFRSSKLSTMKALKREPISCSISTPFSFDTLGLSCISMPRGPMGSLWNLPLFLWISATMRGIDSPKRTRRFSPWSLTCCICLWRELMLCLTLWISSARWRSFSLVISKVCLRLSVWVWVDLYRASELAFSSSKLLILASNFSRLRACSSPSLLDSLEIKAFMVKNLLFLSFFFFSKSSMAFSNFLHSPLTWRTSVRMFSSSLTRSSLTFSICFSWASMLLFSCLKASFSSATLSMLSLQVAISPATFSNSFSNLLQQWQESDSFTR